MLSDMFCCEVIGLQNRMSYVQEKGLKVIEDAAEMIGQCGP